MSKKSEATAVRLTVPLVRETSAVFRLAVEQYVRHTPVARADRCSGCRARNCPVRLRAAEVIRAAGVDPGRYDPPPRRPVAVDWTREPTALLPVYAGAQLQEIR
jgi:hypothetical protein